MISLWLRRALEAVVLVMIGAAPWLFGSVHPLAELLLTAGIAVIALFWALRIALESRPLWRPCAVTAGLAALGLLAVLQLTPMPGPVLATMSPATSHLREQLLPGSAEILDDSRSPLDYPPAATISLAPWATRHMLIRLIAILMLFAAIRANLGSPETFFRLAVVVVVNGVALSLLALAQSLSSSHQVVFWNFESRGDVFGPFICRNHFAYYINLSIGLAISLLLNTRHFQKSAGQRGTLSGLARILQDPTALWLGSALIVMAAALCFSMSRGGMIAALAGAAVCLAFRGRRSAQLANWTSGLVFIVLGAALTTWLGAAAVGRRIASLWESNLLDAGRAPIWNRTLALFTDFPIFGTGLGSFRFVEPLTRGPSDSSFILHEHMHNDYLEMLVEGGLVGLVLMLTILYFVGRAGAQALQRHHGTGIGSLVVGGLFGLTAVAVHSTVDFGLHVPAVMLLTVAVGACVANAAAWPGGIAVEESERAPIRRDRLGALLQIASVLAIALFLLEYAWRCERAERYRLAASAADMADHETQIAYLESALAYTPDQPLLHVAVANQYRLRHQRLRDHQALASHLRALAAHPALGTFGIVAITANARATMLSSEASPDVAAGFAHCFRARSQCPTLEEPHLFMAAYAESFRRGDRSSDYLARACLVDPSNAKTWYIAGVKAAERGDWTACSRSWRRSLECGRDHLPDILDRACAMAPHQKLIAEVVPPEPALLYEASLHFERAEPSGAACVLYVKAASAILASRKDRSAADYFLQARIHLRTHSIKEAVDSYSQALALDPSQADWRLEFCQTLADAGRLRDARRELITLETLNPQYRHRAKRLYDRVNRELAINEEPR